MKYIIFYYSIVMDIWLTVKDKDHNSDQNIKYSNVIDAKIFAIKYAFKNNLDVDVHTDSKWIGDHNLIFSIRKPEE